MARTSAKALAVADAADLRPARRALHDAATLSTGLAVELRTITSGDPNNPRRPYGAAF